MCQQDKTSEYKIWFTMCSKNAAQNIINSLYVSSLSSKWNTIVIFASMVSCASIILAFVDGLEYAQTHLNSEMELFLRTIPLCVINIILKTHHKEKPAEYQG